MTRPRCNLSLLIDHPSLDPDLVTDALGIEPQLTQRRGDATPAGGSNTYSWSKWQYSVDCDITDLEAAVSELMKTLSDRGPELSRLRRDGCNMVLFYRGSNFTHVQFQIDSNTVQDLSRLGVSFGFEFFAPD